MSQRYIRDVLAIAGSPDVQRFELTESFVDNPGDCLATIQISMVRQMKNSKSNATLSKRCTNSGRNIVLSLFCMLSIAGCGDALTPQPYVFEMTRINQDGSINDGSDYSKRPWACVRDNQSGMTWEVKTPGPGLHSVNNTYSWYDPDQASNGGYAGKANGGVCTGSDCDTDSYAKAVNAKKLCGLADWHLPSRFELNTIVDTSIFFPGPTLAKAFFPEDLPGKYWTDTTFKTRRAGAWVWRFDYGNDYVVEKSEALNVRLVNATPKAPEGKQPAK